MAMAMVVVAAAAVATKAAAAPQRSEPLEQQQAAVARRAARLWSAAAIPMPFHPTALSPAAYFRPCRRSLLPFRRREAANQFQGHRSPLVGYGSRAHMGATRL